jgi:hypothetical protein
MNRRSVLGATLVAALSPTLTRAAGNKPCQSQDQSLEQMGVTMLSISTDRDGARGLMRFLLRFWNGKADPLPLVNGEVPLGGRDPEWESMYWGYRVLFHPAMHYRFPIIQAEASDLWAELMELAQDQLPGGN